MTRDGRRLADCRGFSLLEVVVAFAILAVSLGVLYQIFSAAAQRAGLLQQYDRAVSFAESKLARIGTEEPLVVGHFSDKFDDNYRWFSSVEPLDAKRVRTSARAPALFYRVTVAVARNETEQTPLVTLTTVRMRVAP